MTGQDTKPGSDIETAKPYRLTKAQVRALVIASWKNGARRAGERSGFGVTAKTAAKLVEMELIAECALSQAYFVTDKGKAVLDLPENKRRADTMRRLGA
jgi:hypothetical protein